MGREVRRVPADWRHPRDERGNYIPLLDGFNDRLAEWGEGCAKWGEGLRRDWVNGGWVARDESIRAKTYEEWAGPRPEPSGYMTDWPESERTHWQMYETTTEGTPISPVLDSPEALAQWLAEHKASAFGDMTATYHQWLTTIRRGFAVSAVANNGTLESGVAAMSRD